MYENVIDLLKKVDNLDIAESEPMSRHTTFKIGGPARFFLDAKSTCAAVKALEILHAEDISPFIIGNGSNLLVSDGGIDGFVLKISCSKITVCGKTILAEAGALLSSVASVAQKHALCGLEFAHGIPGTVGGAVIMNAGAYGGEIAGVLSKSSFVSGNGVCELKSKDHNFGYRTSFYKQNPNFCVLSAEFELTDGKPDEISFRMRELAEKRREKQPLEFPSAGSVFKRPVGFFAGALIEQCGLKGFSIGGAQVSEKHAGFIINRGGASCEDVKALVEHIQEVVLKETGVSLECEICFV